MKILFVILCFTITSTAGQQLTHFAITQQQGLPSNTVYNIFLDSKGFLWVATENGLARYNGLHFKTYTNSMVRSNAVSGLFEDKAGRIWLHNFFGEILYVENDTLKKLTSWEEYYTEGFPTMSAHGENILITTPNSFYSYSPTDETWTNLIESIPLTERPRQFNHHLINDLNHVLISYANQEATYIRNLTTQEVYTLPRQLYPLNINVVRLVEWNKQLWLFDPVGKKLFHLKKGKVQDILPIYKEKLTDTGLLDNVGDSLLTFAGSNGLTLLNNKGSHTKLLEGKKVSSVEADREGGLWVGTLNEGLFHFPNLTTYLFTKEETTTYHKLALDKKNKLIYAGGSDGGIQKLRYDGTFMTSSFTKTNKEIQSLYVDTLSNHLLFFSDKLYCYDVTNEKLVNERNITAVKKIERVNNGYALATSAGLQLLDGKTLETKQVLTALRTSAVAFDPHHNELWIGSQKGVLIYSFNTSTLRPWSYHKPAYSPGVSDILISQKSILLGTYTNGLLLLKDGKVEKQFTSLNGLPSSHITSLSQTENTIWIGTDNGIASLELSTFKIKTLDAAKGLAAREIYDLLEVDHTLWVSHTQGLQYFTKLVTKNSQKPILHIEHVSSDKQRIVASSEGIELNPSSQQLTISFDVSNNLRSRGATRILYRIKELEKDRWNETTLQSPIANYLFLPSGNLTFEAYAINEDGVASKDKILIPITVLTPFWRQPWFMALLFLLSMGLVSFLLYNRFRQISSRNRMILLQKNQEQELRIAQLTSIRAQMNPHFIFNTMSLIQGKVLNDLKEDANRNIQNFSLLLRKVLDFSGKEMITLQDEIDILEKYLSIEKDRFDGSLAYSISLDENLRQEVIRIPSLLTQPFVENALRHGLMHKEGLKKLSIEFSLADDCITIRIDDNGVGRKTSAEFNKTRTHDHTSFAIEAYQKRIDLLNSNRNKKIELTIIDKHSEHGAATGTTVVILVPIEL